MFHRRKKCCGRKIKKVDFKDIKTTHDYKHWKKIAGGNREEALKAYYNNPLGFCCAYADAYGIK